MIPSKDEKSIIQKLDLDRYIEKFETFLARTKPVAMQGDINQHYRYIKALSTVEFPPPKYTKNLDTQLARLRKQSILSLDELYEFVKIIEYFNRLKSISLPSPLDSWIGGIDLPEAVKDILGYFTEDGTINTEIDRELFDIEVAIKRNKVEIKELLYRLVHSSSVGDYLIDRQIHFQNGEETLLVRGGFNSVLKAKVVGRSSGGYFYIIPQKISHLKDREEELIARRDEVLYRYSQQISAIFSTWERFLAYINKEFDRFDHYQARVSFAKSYEYEFILPTKSKNGKKRVKLVDFAHPAIDNPVLVSIDLNSSIMLITGVNAGGKTMLLKSMLSAVYMSKYLLPFRCDKERTEISGFKSIEAVIDDPQSVKNDISTFAGRMVEFSRLFTKRDAIVGVDEIELGTDSDEAASLFRVMLEELSRRDITFVVTTHHKRLASLMGADDSVELIAALYDEARRLPTYTFLQGSIGKSYAFETAQRYGVPLNIVDKAKVIYGEDKENLNELIEKSTSLEREMREKIALLDKSKEELDSKKRYLDEIEDRLEERHRKAIATLENRYNAATKRAREALKVRESSEGRRLLTDAHKHKQKSKTPKITKDTIPLAEGNRIKYRSHKGEILSIRGDSATILVDGMKMRVPLFQLKRINDIPKIVKKPKLKANINIEKSHATLSVKLLGMYGDEAIETVDKFLSNALLNGLNEVEIIHGRGAGILSKLVKEFLETHPRVRKFYHRGGNFGITVVEL
jgi:DNA mismatch repair protein MutS2